MKKNNHRHNLFRRMLYLVSLALVLLVALFAVFIFMAIKMSFIKVTPGSIAIIVIACAIISILIVTQIATIVWSRKVTKPVTIISDAISKIAQGNFDEPIDTTQFDNEFKTIGESLNKMLSELRSIEVMRSDFVSNVSHEFKAPLSAISGYVTLLSNPSFSEEQRQEYFTLLTESTRQLSGLVDNVLKLSRLESQNIEPKKKEFHLDEQLRVAVLMFESKWEEKNLELDLDMSETVYIGNEDLMNQMWINLIGNAVKFTGEGGKIGVRIFDNNGRTAVTISDTGIGMSPKEKEHLFEKFYQGDTSRKSEGNGLGLALVKSIADLIKADITCESEQGKGTSFTVTLE